MLNQKTTTISKAGLALLLVLVVVYQFSVSSYAALRPGPREGFYEDDGIVYLYEEGKRSTKSGEYKAENGTYTLSEGKVTAAILRSTRPAVKARLPQRSSSSTAWTSLWTR